MPLFSIITVSYNSEKTIAETIESVLGQTIDDFEYWIVDGASTDKTVEIANAYADKFAARGVSFRVISEKDNGIYDAMNKGIRHAGGTLVGIINSDDYYNVDALEHVKAFYQREPFDIVYANLRVFGNGNEFIKRAKRTRKFNTRFWTHPTMFVTKAVYEEIPYVCENMYDDLDFILTAVERNKNIKVLDRVLANFRVGGTSHKRVWRERTERIRIRNRIYEKHNQTGYRFNNWMIETAKYLLG